ncbi:hypothetical protein [Lactococcus cremoris]|uniref:hypothetical protein n=1 Tax=Lactococcus lactis subsp. cremoris TaxID=1359 RepID=UPI002FC5EE40
MLYIIRMGTDATNLSLGWFNPLSWVYLAFPYVRGHENWTSIILTFSLSLILLVISYFLELKRDVGAGYLPEGQGRAQGKKALFGFPGLILSLEKKNDSWLAYWKFCARSGLWFDVWSNGPIYF